jgi:hypothetical protein
VERLACCDCSRDHPGPTSEIKDRRTGRKTQMLKVCLAHSNERGALPAVLETVHNGLNPRGVEFVDRLKYVARSHLADLLIEGIC